MFEEYDGRNRAHPTKQPISYILILVILAAVIFSNAVTFTVVYILTKNSNKDKVIINPIDITVEYNIEDDYYLAVTNKILPSVVDILIETENFGSSNNDYNRGSGVIVGKTSTVYKGQMLNNCPLIVTNRHVIESGITAQGNIFSNVTVMIRFAFKSTYLNLTKGGEGLVNVIAVDPKLDIAVLRLNYEVSNIDDIIIGFADSNKLLYGQTVLAAGNAFGNGLSVTQGLISLPEFTALFSTNLISTDYKMIQHSAAINRGNSGGALVDGNGKLIGINVYSPSNVSDNLAYAIPSNTVRAILDNAMRNASQIISKPSETIKKIFKIELQSSMFNSAKVNIQSENHGMVVVTRPQVANELTNVYLDVDSVDVSSAFYYAGIRTGDRILSFGGAVYFDDTGKYIYHLAMGFPSSLVFEEVLYYYGTEDKGLGTLKIGYYRNSDGKTYEAEIPVYLQEAIPFLT